MGWHVKDAWVKFSAAACIVVLVGSMAFFYFSAPEDAGRRACEQAAAVAMEQGRSGPAAQKLCEDTGREIARISR